MIYLIKSESKFYLSKIYLSLLNGSFHGFVWAINYENITPDGLTFKRLLFSSHTSGHNNASYNLIISYFMCFGKFPLQCSGVKLLSLNKKQMNDKPSK